MLLSDHNLGGMQSDGLAAIKRELQRVGSFQAVALNENEVVLGVEEPGLENGSALPVQRQRVAYFKVACVHGPTL